MFFIKGMTTLVLSKVGTVEEHFQAKLRHSWVFKNGAKQP